MDPDAPDPLPSIPPGGANLFARAQHTRFSRRALARWQALRAGVPFTALPEVVRRGWKDLRNRLQTGAGPQGEAVEALIAWLDRGNHPTEGSEPLLNLAEEATWGRQSQAMQPLLQGLDALLDAPGPVTLGTFPDGGGEIILELLDPEEGGPGLQGL